MACMLGYVLDGDIDFARDRLHAAIDTNKSAIGLTGEPVVMPPVAQVERFTTAHTRPAGSIVHVRHSLLPFPKKEPMKANIIRKGDKETTVA